MVKLFSPSGTTVGPGCHGRMTHQAAGPETLRLCKMLSVSIVYYFVVKRIASIFFMVYFTFLKVISSTITDTYEKYL